MAVTSCGMKGLINTIGYEWNRKEGANFYWHLDGGTKIFSHACPENLPVTHPIIIEHSLLVSEVTLPFLFQYGFPWCVIYNKQLFLCVFIVMAVRRKYLYLWDDISCVLKDTSMIYKHVLHDWDMSIVMYYMWGDFVISISGRIPGVYKWIFIISTNMEFPVKS